MTVSEASKKLSKEENLRIELAAEYYAHDTSYNGWNERGQRGYEHGAKIEAVKRIESSSEYMKQIAELKSFISVCLHKDGFKFDDDAVKAMRLTGGIPWETNIDA